MAIRLLLDISYWEFSDSPDQGSSLLCTTCKLQKQNLWRLNLNDISPRL